MALHPSSRPASSKSNRIRIASGTCSDPGVRAPSTSQPRSVKPHGFGREALGQRLIDHNASVQHIGGDVAASSRAVIAAAAPPPSISPMGRAAGAIDLD